MTRSVVLTAALVLAATAPCFAHSGAGLGQPAAMPAGTPVTATIPATSPRWTRDLGAAPAQLPVKLAVMLKYRHQAELDALVAAQSNPRSRLYRRFLSSDQFDAYFAPDAADHNCVTAALERAGFTVTNTASNRTIIDVTAPAATVEGYFGTNLHRVQERSGVRYANVTAATIPSELQGIVRDVAGLNDLGDGFKTFSHKSPNGPSDLHLPEPDVSGPLTGPNGGYGPLATAKGYDLPVQHHAGNGNPWDGYGITVAVGMWGSISGSDIIPFMKYFGVQHRGKTYVLKVDGGGTYGDPGSDEATLDTETIIGNAPGVDVPVYTIPGPSGSQMEDLYNKVVTQNKVSVFNSSWGVCETDDEGWDSDMSDIVEQGNALGITFAASSGDSGDLECNNGKSKGLEYPASDPGVTAVGGTELFVDSTGKWTSEKGWSGSGGGVSKVFAEPFWQLPIPGTSQSGRNVPDVSFDASPSTPAALYFEGNWGTVGGTSWSSPLFCAFIAEVVKYDHQRMGNATPLLYIENQLFGYGPFHDIKTGNNGFSAHSGYDHVTGIGSVRGWTFTQDQAN